MILALVLVGVGVAIGVVLLFKLVTPPTDKAIVTDLKADVKKAETAVQKVIKRK
jgi:uncharacterized membrane protein YgaE (UPF0421/DUF939 family)